MTEEKSTSWKVLDGEGREVLGMLKFAFLLALQMKITIPESRGERQRVRESTAMRISERRIISVGEEK